MAIVFELLDGYKTGLVAVCDVCGSRVYDGGGAICWDKGKSNIGDRYEFKVVCKGDCDDKLNLPYWQDIGPALVYLANNTKTDMKKAAEVAYMLSYI